MGWARLAAVSFVVGCAAPAFGDHLLVPTVLDFDAVSHEGTSALFDPYVEDGYEIASGFGNSLRAWGIATGGAMNETALFNDIGGDTVTLRRLDGGLFNLD